MSRLRKKRFWFLVFVVVYAITWTVSEVRRPKADLPDISVMDCLEADPHASVVMISRDGQVWVCEKTSTGYSRERLPVSPHTTGPSVAEFSDAIRKQLEGHAPYHLIAQCYGTPVAIRIVSRDPGNVLSLLLINPKGLTEFEWLGNGLIDRSLRSVESVGLWSYDRAVPFSWKSDLPLPRMRWEADIVAHSNFDLTRKDLTSLKIPVGIATDPTTAQAKEFFRIIPQSGWIGADTTSAVSSFFKRAEDAAVAGIPDPAANRVQESLKNYNELYRTEVSGTALVFAMILIALSTLISEDLACIGAGLLVSQGGIGFLPASLACFAGIYFGDIAIYLLGRLFGELLVRKRPFRWFISPKAVQSSEVWFRNQGNFVLWATRFMPGTRVPVYFAAGALKSPFWLVSLILAGAAVIWVPILIYLSCVIGDRMLSWFEQYEQMAIWGVLAAFVFILLVTHNLLPLLTYRGRRLLCSRWKRLTHWEFWPAKAIYPPVFLYVMFLGLRYRSISLASLANPMVRCGGFIDESKIEILRKLQEAEAPIAPYVVLDPRRPTNELIELVKQAQESWYCGYPIVVKPDHGERGKGVTIVKTAEQLRKLLPKLEGPHIAQRYIDGQEFGLFYCRYPGEDQGRITSITRKIYTSVTGDGKTDLEHLILKDDRAVCSARAFLKQHQELLHRVPGDGEKVKLVEIGTHARGSLFLDACDLATPALRERMDAICKKIDGFHLGRFDLKVPNDEALKKGEGISIIELNLLTSEPTHIYDPQHNIFYAWKTLIRQWRTAYEIADINRKAGMKPISHMEALIKVWSHYMNV